MELNERLAQLRKEHGLSQNDLAEKLNVSRQAISRWEQGLAMPSSDNLIYLSRLYGITLDELIHGKKEGGAEKKQNNRRSPPFLVQTCMCVAIVILIIIGVISAIFAWQKSDILSANEIEKEKIEVSNTEVESGNLVW